MLGPRLATSYQELNRYFDASDRYEKSLIRPQPPPTPLPLSAAPIPTYCKSTVVPTSTMPSPAVQVNEVRIAKPSDRAAEDGVLRENERLGELEEIQMEIASTPVLMHPEGGESRRGSLAGSTGKRAREEVAFGVMNHTGDGGVKRGRLSITEATATMPSPNMHLRRPSSASMTDSPLLSHHNAIGSPFPPSAYPTAGSPLSTFGAPASPYSYHSPLGALPSHLQQPPLSTISSTPLSSDTPQQAYLRQQQHQIMLQQQHAVGRDAAMMKSANSESGPSRPSSATHYPSPLLSTSYPNATAIPTTTTTTDPLSLDNQSAAEQYASLQVIISGPTFPSLQSNLKQQLQMNAQTLLYRMQSEAALAGGVAGNSLASQQQQLGIGQFRAVSRGRSPSGGGRPMSASFGGESAPGSAVESSSSYFREQ